MTGIALETRGLGLTLSGRPVLRGVELGLRRGEILGLLGPNGAGKTTLIRALAGQLRGTAPVLSEGADVARLGPEARARRIAYLPQARVVGWPVAVADLVALGRHPWLRLGQRMGPRDREICAAAMAVMDVAALAMRPATELSGGEQARVLAARAIAQDTPVLLADEPASGLDPAHQIGMMSALRRIAAEGRAVLVSLHDLSLAARWCDRLVVLDEGMIAADGRPEVVMQAALLERVFGIAARIERDECGLLVAPTGLAGMATR
ncbi:ABC transporter ATP-binding protein [Halovulum dunhuangense]|uniref:ABC transporter ATP-binding protein n=1 Tax=Halovulum dunhuangense TaxID=1505036 RepID=A0A849L1T7_9RHOB|nr:ABC transporter ATP-binding protein [Halovulum dunhuangense]NNU80197.1 ABC transporter ATP-binding protein [Halovulum dunhuangense]